MTNHQLLRRDPLRHTAVCTEPFSSLQNQLNNRRLQLVTQLHLAGRSSTKTGYIATLIAASNHYSGVPLCPVPFRSVPFRSVPFRSVPFRSVPFRSVPFRSVHPVLSCPVLSCPVLSCPVLSCPVLSCPVLSCPVLLTSHSEGKNCTPPMRKNYKYIHIISLYYYEMSNRTNLHQVTVRACICSFVRLEFVVLLRWRQKRQTIYTLVCCGYA